MFKKDSNFILRSSVRNSMISYNATQKVFRSRFDENRSHSKLNDYANIFVKQLFITNSKIKYELLLGKNKLNYFDLNFYKTLINLNFGVFNKINNMFNSYFFEFPFLTSFKSDASRYL
jgi:hypothetical protein